MPLRCCRFIAADNRCASGIRATLPELILIYEPLTITTQARHYATRGSIITAALPYDCGLSALLLDFEFLLLTICLPRFVMRQNVFLRLAVHDVNIMIGKVDWLYPVTGGINHHRDASTCHAARYQRRHQACG